MADENSTQEPANTDEVSTPPSQAQNSEHMIPKTRFDEVNTKYRALEAQLQQLTDEREKSRQQQLAEQNRFKELYEEAQARLQELDTVKSDAQKYREQLEANNQARIDNVPERRRHLIPDFDDPVRLSAYLDRAYNDLVEPVKPTAPKLDSGSGNVSQATSASLSAEQQRIVDIARQMGYSVDEQRIAEAAKKPKQ